MSYHYSKREARRNSEYAEGDDEEELYNTTAVSAKSSPRSPPGGDTGAADSGPPKGSKPGMEQDKRLRREIANSNERRRMQSINSGFESLKTLIPHTDGEKLSKAAILHHTSDYITSLESEKTRLLSQNAKLKRELLELSASATNNNNNNTNSNATTSASAPATPRDCTESDLSSQGGSPPPKRKKRDTESSDEGIGMSSGDFDEPTTEELKREMIYLRSQLDRERRLRMMLEEQTRTLESQLYPERLRQIASQVQAQMRYQEEKQKYLEEQRRIQEEQEAALVARNTPAPPTPLVIAPPTIQQPLQSPAAPRSASSPPMAAAVSSPATASPPVVKPRLPPVVGNAPPATNSMSRRNLETIVEAIRHLEGDNILFDSASSSSNKSSSSSTSSATPMETDSVYGSSSAGVASSCSDDDDCDRLSASPPSSSSSRHHHHHHHMEPVTHSTMADASTLLALRARDAARGVEEAAPVVRHPHHHHHNGHHSPHPLAAGLPVHHHAGGATTTSLSRVDRYPIASQLLQNQQKGAMRTVGAPITMTTARPAVIVQNLS